MPSHPLFSAPFLLGLSAAWLCAAGAAASCGGGGDEATSGAGQGGATAAGSAAMGTGGSVVGPDGGLDCESVKALAADHAALIDYLAGPRAAGPGNAPTVYDRQNDGQYCFGGCMDPPVDWAGYAGQILFAEQGPGVSRARLSWSKHGGHGGASFAHLYLLRPINASDPTDSDSWFTSPVDPGVDVDAWKAATGGQQLKEPVAVGRGRITWSNNGLLAFRNGLVGAVGSGNSSDSFPFVMLGPGKVPTDVAVTNNSEIALITVWDTTACKGQVAVLALTQRDGNLAALPNEGFFGGIKLLGYVDLPIALPTRIAASVDFGLWMSSSSKDAQAELATQAGRDAWNASADDAHTAAKAGFALVASREEDKVVVLDLEPLMQHYRSMYFTTQQSYDKTLKTGPADDEWPFTFAVAADAVPTVAEVLDVEKPTLVIAGFPVGDRSFTDADFAKKAYVGTLGGALQAYDVGGLGVQGPAGPLSPLSTIATCKNPTRAFYGRGGASRDGLVIACRADRAVHFIDGGGTKTRMFSDSRLIDPVAVSMGDSRGANVLSIADFDGSQVLSYLVAPIDSWGEQLFGGLGADGMAEAELTGTLPLGGKPFGISTAQVP